MSSAISLEPNILYAKLKTPARCLSYNSTKAASSPPFALSSKSSSVVLSGNQALAPAGIASYVHYRPKAKRYGSPAIFLNKSQTITQRPFPPREIILPFNSLGARNPGHSLKIKLRPLMHLHVKRLTAKYRASKMFLPPRPVNPQRFRASPRTLSSPQSISTPL